MGVLSRTLDILRNSQRRNTNGETLSMIPKFHNGKESGRADLQ